ncbi:uncharacterized protein E5676_scaffold436G00610 [Cucumis melo var. makuwa]|uniref:CACTA en-spm transposon protein n=1 Tax=Cucumis melo var. makuwa TaxID=1194695 RepID=A0A5D3DR81_CUCMM|nr:uncharacterized protein E5676_scaffold436G00610 [Cucumis melo var. makuwa]
MISSHSRWDLHLTFDPTMDALHVGLDVDPIVVERSIVRHVVDNFINDDDEQLSVQSRSNNMSFPSGFNETDALFDFDVNVFNNAGGTSSVGNTCTISVLTHDTFPFRFLKWAGVTSEYIKLVKGELHEQLMMNRAARAKQLYNHSSGSKLALQRQQHELTRHPVD